MHTQEQTSLDNSDEAQQTPPQFFTREAHVQEIRRLIRLSADTDTAISDGVDYFAVQGDLARAKLERA